MHAHLVPVVAGMIARSCSTLDAERVARSTTRARDAIGRSRGPTAPPPAGFGIVAESGAMKLALALVGMFAPSLLPVILCGPTGTGKTLLARYLHACSGRTGTLVTVTGAELAAGLAESEFYGHVRGAFTGAMQRMTGVIAQAAGGTLFLDDLTFMPLELQAKLLRVLDQALFRPVGGARDISAQCRFVVGLHGDPDELLAANRLLEDLRERLGECVVRLAALAERRPDIPPLADHFLRLAPLRSGVPGPARFAPGVLPVLEAAPWPRNVRQLEHTIYRAFLVARPNEAIEFAHLPEPLNVPPRFVRHGDPVQNQLAVRYARAVCGGRDDLAARLLGIHRNAIARYPRDNGWAAGQGSAHSSMHSSPV